MVSGSLGLMAITAMVIAGVNGRKTKNFLGPKMVSSGVLRLFSPSALRVFVFLTKIGN